MKTYKTYTAAKEEADKKTDYVDCIINISHKTDGDCYIISKVPEKTIKANLRSLPEIVKVLNSTKYTKCTKSKKVCYECGKEINGTIHTEWIFVPYKINKRIKVHYCKACYSSIISSTDDC